MTVSLADRHARAGTMVRDLREVGTHDVATAGAKAASLAKLIAADVPVPDGFVIETSAFAAFVDASGLRERIADRLAGLDVDCRDEVDQAAADIRLGFDMTEFPGAVSAAIGRAYAQLSGDPGALVAVRSSTTTIDTSTEVLAHLNETVLCVRRIGPLLDAVRRCWASLYAPRALVLRHKLGFDRGDIDAAVIVQRQVNPTRSGFMATGATDDDAPDRLVVEAIYGLGEAAISGLVAPDRFAVDKSSLGILSREVHHKGLVVEERPPDGGTRQRCVSGEQADRAALLDSEIREIARVGAQVEDRFGGPQVVEWALDRDGRVWVLQSCPLDSASFEQRCAIGLRR